MASCLLQQPNLVKISDPHACCLNACHTAVDISTKNKNDTIKDPSVEVLARTKVKPNCSKYRSLGDFTHEFFKATVKLPYPSSNKLVCCYHCDHFIQKCNAERHCNQMYKNAIPDYEEPLPSDKEKDKVVKLFPINSDENQLN